MSHPPPVEIGALDGSQTQVAVWFKAMPKQITGRFVQIRQALRQGRLECCALCRAPFQPGDFVTLCANNQTVFPNCFVHTACMTWENMTGIARTLRDSWQEAQQFAHWF